MLVGDNNDQVLKGVKRSAHSSGEGPSWLLPLFTLGDSLGQRYRENWAGGKIKRGQGSSVVLGFGEGWWRSCLGEGIHCHGQSPAQSCCL